MASAIVFYVYMWIYLVSIEERASATRMPITEQKSSMIAEAIATMTTMTTTMVVA